jgi:hypothetical protein
MGVMLCLDRPGPARGQRHGHHARSAAVRATADAIAAFLRSGVPVVGRRRGRRALGGSAARPAAAALVPGGAGNLIAAGRLADARRVEAPAHAGDGGLAPAGPAPAAWPAQWPDAAAA